MRPHDFDEKEEMVEVAELVFAGRQLAFKRCSGILWLV